MFFLKYIILTSYLKPIPILRQYIYTLGNPKIMTTSNFHIMQLKELCSTEDIYPLENEQAQIFNCALPVKL